MKLLIIDVEATMLSWAWRASQAGHQVRWFINPEISDVKEIGSGFKGIEKVENFVPSLKWADLILVSGNKKYIERLATLKQHGFPIFGPTVDSAILEIYRIAGIDLLENAGIEVAPYEIFNSMEDAARHIEKTGQQFVFKTLNANESLTYVSLSAADMLIWMGNRIRLNQQPRGKILLQKFIDGIEIGVSRFMGSNGFVGPWNESLRGEIVSFTKDSILGERTLAGLEKDLVKMGHTGEVSLNFIVADGRPYAIDFTTCLKWPKSNIVLASIKDDPIVWMKDALNGEDTISFREEIGCCLNLTHEDSQNIPIYGITKSNKKYIYPRSVKIDLMPYMDNENIVERPLWNTTGKNVLTVTGFGKDIKQAKDRAHKTMWQLKLVNSLVRNDPAEYLKEDLLRLHEIGFALHAEYQI